MECLFIVSLPPNALYSVSCIIANLFFCSQHFFLDNLYYLFVSWSQQAFSGVLYYSGAFFFGGGGIYFRLTFSTRYFALFRMSRMFLSVVVYQHFVPVHYVMSNQVTNIILLSWSRHVSLSRRVSWVSYLMYYTRYLLIHMFCMYYCCCWIFFSIQSTT